MQVRTRHGPNEGGVRLVVEVGPVAAVVEDLAAAAVALAAVGRREDGNNGGDRSKYHVG